MSEPVQLSDAQIDQIAEKAAEKALQKVYAQVGESVLKKLAWYVGVVTLAIIALIAGKDALFK